jgi:two-component system cell cycle sensor histidine kinase/response regulator CckA
LLVSDSGQGMDDATRERVFEPFFTTKEPGRGTGLGLAMVYGFVKQCEGHVEIRSELGVGTTFHIYLPCATELDPLSAPPEAERSDTAVGTETVLLVDDEYAVRMLSRLSLEARGYRVLEASDGAAALRVAREHPSTIDILVTDVVMPGMGGPELSHALTAERPLVPTLFISGYAGDAVARRIAEAPRTSQSAFLQKPFRPVELARQIRDLLDTVPARPL